MAITSRDKLKHHAYIACCLSHFHYFLCTSYSFSIFSSAALEHTVSLICHRISFSRAPEGFYHDRIDVSNMRTIQ